MAIRTGYQYRHFGGFRLLLAALVMLQHFGADLAPERLANLLAPYAMGSMAVLVFFALSGFVITEAVDCVYRERPRAFMGNRLLRIVPHFLLAVAFSMLAHEIFRAVGGVRLWRSFPSFPSDAFAAGNVALNFIGIAPLADRFIDYNFLDITWAVRIEMAFYIVMWGCVAIGRKLPGTAGFALAASGAAVLLIPLFLLAIYGKGVAMFGYLPYFVLGGGLYYASIGRRGGWATVVLTVPAILWQSIALPIATPIPGAAQPSLLGNLLILTTLLSVFAALAFSRISRWRKIDTRLGNLTYPLYLYHEEVLIVVLTFTVGYSYTAFAVGIALSVVATMVLAALVDPLVNQYRDRIRGGAVRGRRSAFRLPDGVVRGASSVR